MATRNKKLIQKQPLLLLIRERKLYLLHLLVNSKTTFVTVNPPEPEEIDKLTDYSKTTFVTVNQPVEVITGFIPDNSKTTFVTVNLVFLTASFF